MSEPKCKFIREEVGSWTPDELADEIERLGNSVGQLEAKLAERDAYAENVVAMLGEAVKHVHHSMVSGPEKRDFLDRADAVLSGHPYEGTPGVGVSLQPTDYICVACDGCGWCEGSPAFKCERCNGTGRVPNSFGLCEGCPPAAHKDATTRCAQCPRREEPPKSGREMPQTIKDALSVFRTDCKDYGVAPQKNAPGSDENKDARQRYLESERRLESAILECLQAGSSKP